MAQLGHIATVGSAMIKGCDGDADAVVAGIGREAFPSSAYTNGVRRWFDGIKVFLGLICWRECSNGVCALAFNMTCEVKCCFIYCTWMYQWN